MRVLIEADQYGNDCVMTSELTPAEIVVVLKALDGARFCRKDGWGVDRKIEIKSEYGEVRIEIVQTLSKLVCETLKDEVAKVVIAEAHKEEEPI